MQDINIFEYSGAILEQLSRGAFLNTAAGGRQNTMTIGWGSLGFMWGRPVFTVMVRESRYTKELIDSNPVFTVSVPAGGFTKELALCGTKSGRDADKFALAGLTAEKGRTVDAPVVKGCGIQIECRVADTQVMAPSRFDKELACKWYGSGDWHTYYTGVITAAYKE